MDKIKDSGIPINNIINDQRQFKEKAKLEVKTFRILKLYGLTKYLYNPVKTSF
jgi:hypothetical protein